MESKMVCQGQEINLLSSLSLVHSIMYLFDSRYYVQEETISKSGGTKEGCLEL